jgi:hypothetical protein
MSEACGVPHDVLRWTQEWYVREETLREANTCIVNHHHGWICRRCSAAARCPPRMGKLWRT